MTSILSHLQSATGPSRELDREVARANGWIYHSGPNDHWRSPAGQICPNVPRYTESIDAAMTLVKVQRLTIDWVLGTASVMTDSGTEVGTAKTGNFALLIAICKAKEEK